jgi:F-type H+-transporting ATPase subunit b
LIPRILILAAVLIGAIAVPRVLAETPAGSADAAQADPHAKQPNIFGGGIGNMIWTTIIFAIVVVVLRNKAWPQLLKALNDREQSIRTSLENAKREREAAEKLLADYKRQIDQARVEATAIVDEGRRDADAVRRRIQEEARRESDEMVARARREILLARDTAIKDLYDSTAELAVQVAGGIIRKELRADDHRSLVTESLERMKASQN